jgi:hypothetical protein
MKKKMFFLFFSFVLLFLTSCSSIGLNGIPFLNTKTPTLTASPNITSTPTVTATPRPTLTPMQSPTLRPGSFSNPLPIGAGIVLPEIPEENRKPGSNGLGSYGFQLLEVKRGEEAKQIALSKLGFMYINPGPSEEFLAIHGRLIIYSYQDNSEIQTIYPGWHVVLRYSDGDYDTWAENRHDVSTQGYPPIEGNFWLIYKIYSGQKPYAYFQPDLYTSEYVGLQNFGAYFNLD